MNENHKGATEGDQVRVWPELTTRNLELNYDNAPHHHPTKPTWVPSRCNEFQTRRLPSKMSMRQKKEFAGTRTGAGAGGRVKGGACLYCPCLIA
eukprot:528501-Rhodomonas_salina.3